MKGAKIKAMEMVRRIRDRHARALAHKKPSEVITFYRKAGQAALEQVKQRSRVGLRKAG